MPGLPMWSRGAFLWNPLPARHSRGPSSPSKEGVLAPLPPTPTQRIVPMLPSLVISLSSLLLSADSWIRDRGTFKLDAGQRSFVVDTARAGVVATFSWKGRNLLGFESGSFRPATQATWNNGAGWPPPPEWVDRPYRPTLLSGGAVLHLEGEVDSRRLRPVRRIRFDASDSSLVNEYVVRNTASDSARHVAAWEIVRLPPGAIQFFPKGQELSGVSNTLRSDREDSIVWVADDGQRDGKLLYRDGKEGWMAAVVDSLLLVKTWTDIPLGKIPPGQGEIQVYLQKNPAFAEMECMGPWTAVLPRDSTVWTVRWKVAPIPQHVSRTLGNPQLVRLARAMASSAVTSVSRRDRPGKRDGGVWMDASGRLVSRPDVSRPVEPRRTFSVP